MPTEEMNDMVFGVNYFGVKNVGSALYPLLKPHARLVFETSQSLRSFREISENKPRSPKNEANPEIKPTAHY